jgi:predicted aminopeptidase
MFSLLKRIFCRTFLWLMGWKTTSRLPADVKKYLVVLVPHTSNWDFPYGVASRPFIGIDNCNFLIKRMWVDAPVVGRIIRWLGAIPVDRSKNTNLVDQVVEAFAKRERLGVAVTPEGTRSRTKEWKTGFYHIAHKAQVPIACGFIDYHHREIGIGKVFYTTGNMEADIEELKDFYRDKTPMYPDKSSLEHRLPAAKRGLMWKLVPAWRWALFLLLLLALFNYELIGYGLMQAYGQLRVVWQARPVAEALADPAVSEEHKEKMRLVQEIRRYAFDSLGLDPSESYTSVYDDGQQALLWNVTACAPYRLEAYTWQFPLLGSFSYKGFFSHEAAEEARLALEEAGYDTQLYEVGGWSTLGLMADPLLTSMLDRSEGSLANLIIHELTHGTLYVKDGVSYNENLASFVGDEGARRFLASKYGPEAAPLRRYDESQRLQQAFNEWALAQAMALDTLYASFAPGMPEADKRQAKGRFMQAFVDSLAAQPLGARYAERFEGELPNNTFFLSRRRYNGQQRQFRDEFEQRFGSDFKRYMAYLKATYPSLL